MKQFTLGRLQVLFITIILLIAIYTTALLLNHNTDNNNIHMVKVTIMESSPNR